MSQKRNSDDAKINCDANKQIAPKKRICVKSKAVQRQQQQQYVGLDVHKESIQVAVMDKNRKVLRNTKISNKESEIKKMFVKKRGKVQVRSGCSIQAAAHIILDAKEVDDLQSRHRRYMCVK